ncbi:hypothetical protein F0562_015162 [Nyssa sinensis]|uniref:Plant bHLH transcription factor ACT-like domain-containing protein n=1 Tax=Nyssa sinensis TaxID=561372 RepID=A0A5J4ZJI4_9ASTE|nr:hypothetical protein F0562_015162 [Nyssa sinensis]
MGSREQKRAALYEKLQQLRSATSSSAVNKTSIIVDASKYIEELKGRVERLNQEVASSQSSLPMVLIIQSVSFSSTVFEHNSTNLYPIHCITYILQQVTVETLKKGFRINVFSEKNCPGLLVSVLEAFEELGLDVLDAKVSCSDNFRLEAVGGENHGQADSIDAQVVKQAVLQAIRNWSNDQE